VKISIRSIFILVLLAFTSSLPAFDAGGSPPTLGDSKDSASPQRSTIYDLGVELERQATVLAQESFDHFRGWNGTISDREQGILFKSEAFAASCRLFLKLTESQSDFFQKDNLRTNVFNAFTYLAASFGELEREMRGSNVMPYALSDCRKVLTRMESEFAAWPDADNIAYLDGKFVKASDATVYLIEKRSIGAYIKRPFRNLERFFRYNYDRNQGKDPWKFLVETSEETLDKMKTEETIDLTFESKMIIELSTRKDRSVYLIQAGKKRPITRPDIVGRLGGWSQVYEVPREIIDGYENGDLIDRLP
jgi:hypothetical protein